MNSTKIITGFSIAIIALGIVCRFVFLSQDLPSQRLASHNEADQFFYLTPSLMWADLGEFAPENTVAKKNKRLLFDVFQNLCTVPSVALFGDNIWAIKLPAAVLSIFALYLLFLTLKLLDLKHSTILLVLAFAAWEFMFFTSSKVQNPTVYSVFGITLLIWILARLWKRDQAKDAFFAGAVAVGITLFIYVYNVYASVAAGCFILHFSWTRQHFWKTIILFVAGAIATFLLYNVVIYLMFEKTFIDLLEALQNFGTHKEFRFMEKKETNQIARIKNVIGALLNFNILKFSLVLFPFIVLGFAKSIQKSVKENHSLHLFLILSIAAIAAQTWFEPLHSNKKLTSLFPILMIWVAIAIEKLTEQSTLTKRQQLVSIGLVLIGTCLALYNYKITTSDWYQSFRLGEPSPFWYNALNLGVLCLISAWLVGSLFIKKFRYAWVCGLLMLIPTLSMTINQHFLNRTYRWTTGISMINSHHLTGVVSGDYCYQLMGGTPLIARLHSKLFDGGNYQHRLDSLLLLDEIDHVNFIRNKPFKGGYDFEHVYGIYGAEIGDTLLKGANYVVMVDQILPMGQQVELYFGSRMDLD